MPDLPIVADGENDRGEHWYLKAAGSPADYYTMLETLHPDGRRDEGGMGGAPLYPGSRYNSYTGRADDGPLRVIIRTDPRVRRLRLGIRTTRDETLDLLPLAEDPEVGLCSSRRCCRSRPSCCRSRASAMTASRCQSRPPLRPPPLTCHP
jgi:hypothetical protein